MHISDQIRDPTGDATERILREFPPNPMLVNYHTRQQLTKQMSERYLPGKAKYPEPLIAGLAALDSLTNIHVLRHKLRLKRRGDIPWEKITVQVEPILRAYWGPIAIRETERLTDVKRRYKLPDGMVYEKRQVFEGVYHSRNHELAEALYAIRGITTLVLHRRYVQVKRGYCFPWEELEPQILRCLHST